MSQSPPAPPGWFPDPSGRHQFRWWDGAAFSDQVADGGVVGADDGAGPVTPLIGGPAVPRPVGPPWAAAPVDAGGFVVVAGSGPPRWVYAAGGLGLVALLVAGTFLVLDLADDGGSGFGELTGEVDGDVGGAHPLRIPAGSVVTVELRPDDDDFDPRVAFVVDEESLDALEEAFDGTDLQDAFGADQATEAGELFEELDLGAIDVDVEHRVTGIYFVDLEFEGEDEELVLLAPIAVDGTLVVGGGFAETEGSYELTVERVAVDRGADGDDFVDGVLDAGNLPRDTRDLVEDLLDRLGG
ncbi:MAG: DUF2510 domain-containing protein [Acidimicrobiia bacterium]|jgi:hypothetical protein|nr:DUF2510 domain-containing protein [Acidimicrobiia bacterium]